MTPGSSPIQIHYFNYPKRFSNQRNEVYEFSIKYRYSSILVKNHKRYFIEKSKTSSITVCFAAIRLAIVLAWFLRRQRHTL